MNTINYRISLDMLDTISQTTIKAKKGDSACKIYITLTKYGKIFTIGEDCYATFNAKKSDGNYIYDNCTIEGDTIVYDFASSIDENGVCQVSAIEGITDCEVTLYNAQGEQLTSPRFTLYIDGVVLTEESASFPESDVLKTLVATAKSTIGEAKEIIANTTASVAQTEDGAVITITDKNGATSATISNGKDGEDGYSLFVNSNSSLGTIPVDISPVQAKYGKDVIPNDTIIFDNKIMRVISKQSENVAICAVLGSIKGKDGENYILTEADKTEMVHMVLDALPLWEGGAY